MTFKHFFTLIAIFISSQSFAQELSTGILSSYNMSMADAANTKIGNEKGYVTHTVDFIEIENSYDLGAFVQYNTANIFARVEGTYNALTANYETSDRFSIRNEAADFSEKSSFININVLGGLDFNGFNISTGPAIHFMTDHQNDLENLDYYSQSPSDISYGFIGSLGYDYSIFHIDVRYERNFRNVDNNARFNKRGARFDQQPNMIKFVVGIRLF